MWAFIKNKAKVYHTQAHYSDQRHSKNYLLYVQFYQLNNDIVSFLKTISIEVIIPSDLWSNLSRQLVAAPCGIFFYSDRIIIL